MVIVLIGLCTFSIPFNSTNAYSLHLSLSAYHMVGYWEMKENEVILFSKKHSSH